MVRYRGFVLIPQEDLNLILVAPLAAAYTNFSQQEQAELYSGAFRDADLELTAEAVKRCILVFDFLPTVAQIRAESRMIASERAGLQEVRELPMPFEEEQKAKQSFLENLAKWRKDHPRQTPMKGESDVDTEEDRKDADRQV